MEGRRLQMGQLSDHDWGVIDWTAMVGVWVGTMLYNVSCITPAVLCTLPAPLPPNVQALILKWAVAVPNVVAGCLFVSGSFTCWAAAAKTCSLPLLLQGRTLSGGHLGFLLYLLGSVGFLSGSLLTQPLLVFAPTILIDEWFGLFAGYLLGSLCFLSGSFLTVAAPPS
ncbi:hypothetical protein COCOBI_09-2270 [Coccomyxa sp. Obi]|nr:hypothetical protein COCOBI_09-2270 [Coccomyxa sp. Obi]